MRDGALRVTASQLRKGQRRSLRHWGRASLKQGLAARVLFVPLCVGIVVAAALRRAVFVALEIVYFLTKVTGATAVATGLAGVVAKGQQSKGKAVAGMILGGLVVLIHVVATLVSVSRP